MGDPSGREGGSGHVDGELATGQWFDGPGAWGPAGVPPLDPPAGSSKCRDAGSKDLRLEHSPSLDRARTRLRTEQNDLVRLEKGMLYRILEFPQVWIRVLKYAHLEPLATDDGEDVQAARSLDPHGRCLQFFHVNRHAKHLSEV